MKNVYLLIATQDLQLGYALDSSWYGIGEYCATLRDRLVTLTRDDVHSAIRRHLSSQDLAVVIVTKEAEALRDALVANTCKPAPAAALVNKDSTVCTP